MNWQKGLRDGIAVLVGAAIGYYGARFIPTSGLMRVILGFAVAFLGVFVDHDGVELAVQSAGAVIIAQGLVSVSVPAGL